MNNARGCNYTYKFHSNIHNKMDDNIGIALQHGTDFDIPKTVFVELICLSADLKIAKHGDFCLI